MGSRTVQSLTFLKRVQVVILHVRPVKHIRDSAKYISILSLNTFCHAMVKKRAAVAWIAVN